MNNVDVPEHAEDGFDGFTPDELVVHVDDVFAGRAGRWGRARRGSRTGAAREGLRGRLRAHPWLAGSAALAISLWVLLGVLGALAGRHPVPAHRAAPATSGARIVAGHPAARTTIVYGISRGRHVEHRAHVRGDVRSTCLVRRRMRPVRPSHSLASTVEQADTVDRPAPAAPSVPVRTSEAPPVEQASGGLFSP
jgi:hypothetical protein